MFLILSIVFGLIYYRIKKSEWSFDDTLVGLVERAVRFAFALLSVICLVLFVASRG